MSEKLENYLEEISRYLGTSKEKREILQEIKSHIMEKAEQEFGVMARENLDRIIGLFGTPQQVAAKYMEDQQIIAPTFKGYLLRYTIILFAVHLAFTVFAMILKIQMLVFPFFYIPKMDNVQALFYLPMTFIYDLGLVGIILYFVTQSRKEIRLPWPRIKLNWQKMADKQKEKPKVIFFFLALLGYAALVYFYMRFGTLFFKSLNPGEIVSLFAAEASRWYSMALLSLLGVGLLAYLVKFFARSEWINLLRSACQLVILGIVINRPVENAMGEFLYFDILLIADLVVLVIAILLAADFLKSLIIIGIRAFRKKSPAI